jgi:hypothetical protein
MMKRSSTAWIAFFCAAVLVAGCVATGKYKPVSDMGSLEITLADPAWNGKTVPMGQQCRKFGGNGATPAMTVANIPAQANAVILEFSDQSHQPMDNGGHGKIGYRIAPGTARVTVPSVPGHTFDLPSEFFLVAAHRNPSWDKAGAYMPPCSGGRGNLYYLTVKAVFEAPGESDGSKLLGQGKLTMGRY